MAEIDREEQLARDVADKADALNRAIEAAVARNLVVATNIATLATSGRERPHLEVRVLLPLARNFTTG